MTNNGYKNLMRLSLEIDICTCDTFDTRDTLCTYKQNPISNSQIFGVLNPKTDDLIHLSYFSEISLSDISLSHKFSFNCL